MKNKVNTSRLPEHHIGTPDDASLMNALGAVQQKYSPFFLSGGTVRDQLLGRQPLDLDITVANGAVACCHELIRQLGGGAFVPLGAEEEEAARVVWRGNCIDFSAFRKKATTIEEDLQHRDYTINAMAISFLSVQNGDGGKIIDPLGGRVDLERARLRHCPNAFTDDPLRMLRGYRFCAELGVTMDNACKAAISTFREGISKSAAERIHYELERIMSSGVASAVVEEMAETSLLWQILPELKDGLGMAQPGYHHEDVFHHNLLALQHVDRVIERPQQFFSRFLHVITRYLEDERRKNHLRWSALFHDLGKPATHASGTIKKGRITFYNHDEVGRTIFENIAARLKWSSAATEVVGNLIEMHMHPFHLCNVARKTGVSRKACLRICKRAGDDLPGLFLLAMADSLAGQGELKPEGMEEELAQLFAEVQSVRENLIDPVLRGKRLLTGHDLINSFGLSPSPLFSRIFNDLEIAMVEERVTTKGEALRWVEHYLQSNHES